MIKKAFGVASVCLMLVLLVVSLFGVLNVGVAQPLPGITLPYMSTFSIASDGTVSTGAPITQDENVYTLTGDITSSSLTISCNNIVFDGAGRVLQSDLAGASINFAPSAGIYISGENVTVKNINVYRYAEGEILVHGGHDTISGCNLEAAIQGGFETGIDLASDNNTVVGNRLSYCGIDIEGNFNVVERNFLSGDGISMPDLVGDGSRFGTSIPDANYNIIAANTIQDCHLANYSVYPSSGIDLFFLNNFVNNTNINFNGTQDNVSPYQWQLTLNGVPISGDQWSPKAVWLGIYPNDIPVLTMVCWAIFGVTITALIRKTTE